MSTINLENVGGSCEPTGSLSKIWVADYNHATTIPELPAICGDTPAASLEAAGTIDADIVFGTDQGFVELDFIDETGSLNAPMAGNRQGRIFENTAVCEIEGSTAKLIGLSRVLKNKDLLVLIEMADTGEKRLLGANRMPAWCEGLENVVEAAREGKNGFTLTFKDKVKSPAPIYTGVLTTQA
jgi:hypothetical protein